MENNKDTLAAFTIDKVAFRAMCRTALLEGKNLNRPYLFVQIGHIATTNGMYTSLYEVNAPRSFTATVALTQSFTETIAKASDKASYDSLKVFLTFPRIRPNCNIQVVYGKTVYDEWFDCRLDEEMGPECMKIVVNAKNNCATHLGRVSAVYLNTDFFDVYNKLFGKGQVYFSLGFPLKDLYADMPMVIKPCNMPSSYSLLMMPWVRTEDTEKTFRRNTDKLAKQKLTPQED